MRDTTAPGFFCCIACPAAAINVWIDHDSSSCRSMPLLLMSSLICAHAFFGLTVSSEGFDPPPVDSSTPNPPPPDPKPPGGSPAGMNSVNSFSPPLHAERNGVSSKKGENPKRKNPSNPANPSLPGLSTAPIGSTHDVESDDDDPHWGPKTG